MQSIPAVHPQQARLAMPSGKRPPRPLKRGRKKKKKKKRSARETPSPTVPSSHVLVLVSRRESRSAGPHGRCCFDTPVECSELRPTTDSGHPSRRVPLDNPIGGKGEERGKEGGMARFFGEEERARVYIARRGARPLSPLPCPACHHSTCSQREVVDSLIRRQSSIFRPTLPRLWTLRGPLAGQSGVQRGAISSAIASVYMLGPSWILGALAVFPAGFVCSGIHPRSNGCVRLMPNKPEPAAAGIPKWGWQHHPGEIASHLHTGATAMTHSGVA